MSSKSNNEYDARMTLMDRGGSAQLLRILNQCVNWSVDSKIPIQSIVFTYFFFLFNELFQSDQS